MSNAFRTTWQQLVGFFVAGVLAVLPLVLTVGIVIWLVHFLEGMIGPSTLVGTKLRSLGLRFSSDTVTAYVLGWVIVLTFVFALGVVVSLGARKFIERATNAVIRRLPVLGNVYQTAAQVVDMLKPKDPSELKGMSVVYCLFGDKGAGVLALMPSPERFRIDGRDYHVVIIPTAPVPIGGALLFMPADQVKPANISADGLMSIYVSMGVTVPQYLPAGAAAAPGPPPPSAVQPM